MLHPMFGQAVEDISNITLITTAIPLKRSRMQSLSGSESIDCSVRDYLGENWAFG